MSCFDSEKYHQRRSLIYKLTRRRLRVPTQPRSDLYDAPSLRILLYTHTHGVKLHTYVKVRGYVEIDEEGIAVMHVKEVGFGRPVPGLGAGAKEETARAYLSAVFGRHGDVVLMWLLGRQQVKGRETRKTFFTFAVSNVVDTTLVAAVITHRHCHHDVRRLTLGACPTSFICTRSFVPRFLFARLERPEPSPSQGRGRQAARESTSGG